MKIFIVKLYFVQQQQITRLSSTFNIQRVSEPDQFSIFFCQQRNNLIEKNSLQMEQSKKNIVKQQQIYDEIDFVNTKTNIYYSIIRSKFIEK